MISARMTRKLSDWNPRPAMLLQLALGVYGVLLMLAPVPSKAVLGLAVLIPVAAVALFALQIDLSLGLILWLLFFPFYRGWSFLQLPGLPNLSPDRLVWLSVGTLVVLEILLSARRDYRVSAVELAMALFLAITFVSMLQAGTIRSREAFGDYLNRHFIPMTLFPLAVHAFREEAQLRRLLVAGALVSIYLGATAIFEHLGLRSLVFPRYIMDPSVGIHFGRARGPLLQAAANGTLLSMLFPICLFGLTVVPGKSRYLFLPGLFLLPVGVFFTYTRAAYLGLLAGAAFYFLRSRRARKWLLIGIPVLVIVAVVLGPLMMQQYESVRSDDTLPILDRLNLYATAINMFLHSPVWGHGFYTFPEKSPLYFTEIVKLPRFWVGHGTPSHNTFLEILADEGLLGIIPFLAVFVFLTLRFLRESWGERTEDVRSLYLGLSAALFVNSFFVVQNRVVIFGLYFLMCGALLGISRGGTPALVGQPGSGERR